MPQKWLVTTWVERERPGSVLNHDPEPTTALPWALLLQLYSGRFGSEHVPRPLPALTCQELSEETFSNCLGCIYEKYLISISARRSAHSYFHKCKKICPFSHTIALMEFFESRQIKWGGKEGYLGTCWSCPSCSHFHSAAASIINEDHSALQAGAHSLLHEAGRGQGFRRMKLLRSLLWNGALRTWHLISEAFNN